jgi:hypothetical protein
MGEDQAVDLEIVLSGINLKRKKLGHISLVFFNESDTFAGSCFLCSGEHSKKQNAVKGHTAIEVVILKK